MTALPAASVRRFAARFVSDETGATAVEYSLMCGLMALVCITAFTQLGGASGGAWADMAGKITAVMK
jgi:pilus assembly protein Flp/PilA